MDSLIPMEKIRRIAAKYKHALLVLLLGLGLMLLPLGGGEADREEPKPAAVETVPESLEQRLEAILSRISGAGQVSVLLTQRTGEEILYQEDTQKETTGDSSRVSTDTVLSDNDQGRETGLVRRVDPPVYLGAVIVCQGADDPKVRLAIVEAVRCATGLGANQISVVKMNGMEASS